MREIDEYFLQNEEPIKSCLDSLRHLILHQNTNIVEVWRYRMPFYCHKSEDGSETRFCYLWVDKKRKLPMPTQMGARLVSNVACVAFE